jgi:hypothetical protein
VNLPRLSMNSTTPEEHLEKAVYWTSEAEAIANTIMESGDPARWKGDIEVMRGLIELAALQTDLAFAKRQLRRPTLRRDNK